MSFKNTVPYFLAIALCITCYFISKSVIEKQTVEEEIVYSSDLASEVQIQWGINYFQEPPQQFWPSGSYLKKGMVHTMLIPRGEGKFSLRITLPVGTILNYWILLVKDKNGKELNTLYTGGLERSSYNIYYSYGFRPGLFVFFAGVLPLLMFYFKKRKHVYDTPLDPSNTFKVDAYIKQLDSIRAIAVLMVILHHWTNNIPVFNFLADGELGVNIFFVLSGFLITRILLNGRKQIDEHGLKKTAVFKNFYIRRSLRIFPIYYLLLIILLLIDDPNIKNDGLYYFTYTSNYLFYSGQFWPDKISHLWSLAVEEQFYLLWPWLVILIHRRLLPYVIALFIVIGISSNYIFTDNGWWVYLLTPACFDAFGIGAALSYCIVYRQDTLHFLNKRFYLIAFISFLLLVLRMYGFYFLPTRTIHSFFGVIIIYYCVVRNDLKMPNLVFNNRFLQWLGKISYGIYLYHVMIPGLWKAVLHQFSLLNIDLLYNEAMPLVFKSTWLFIQHFIVLIIISALSWSLIEKPLNMLKEKFSQKDKAQSATQNSSVIL